MINFIFVESITSHEKNNTQHHKSCKRLHSHIYNMLSHLM